MNKAGSASLNLEVETPAAPAGRELWPKPRLDSDRAEVRPGGEAAAQGVRPGGGTAGAQGKAQGGHRGGLCTGPAALQAVAHL